MKKTIKNLIVFSLGVTLLASCGKEEKATEGGQKLTKAEGGRTYGGKLRINESEYFKSLFPPSITDGISTRIATQIYEGLLKFDQEDLSIKNAIAESYSVSEDGKLYTFKIKKGVFFHNDPCFANSKGRELTAEDIKYCFTQLCTQSAVNQGFILFEGVLKGATEYYNATSNGTKPSFDVSGIKVINASTIQFELVAPNSLFTTYLALPFTSIYPKEAVDKYGLEMRTKAVGTGPFTLASVDDDIQVLLKKNAHYYGKDKYNNKLPLIEAVDIKFLHEKKTELFEFKKGNLDMIYRLPTEYILDILEGTQPDKEGDYSQYELQRKPEMATQFLTFNYQSELFKNKNLRKAISFAIDRDKILNYILKGEGIQPGFFGITPPAFNDYKIEGVKGYKLNKDSARYYLKKAGYENGKNFPELSLQLNTDGDRNTDVAIEIQKELKENLNINVKLDHVPFAQLVENMIGGKSQFYRSGWIADYPSPENFLRLFYGKSVPKDPNAKSYPNFARYTNANFDKFYEEGIAAKDKATANENFMKAERILMEDAPIIVLWYDEGYRLLQSNLKNFPNNPMQVRDYSEVYFELPKEE
jgi:oligopeptide transport system substrate-binding protein